MNSPTILKLVDNQFISSWSTKWLEINLVAASLIKIGISFSFFKYLNNSQ